MVKVVFKTNMSFIPKNCSECTFGECTLPLDPNGELRYKYLSKRHPDCGLELVDFVNKPSIEVKVDKGSAETVKRLNKDYGGIKWYPDKLKEK